MDDKHQKWIFLSFWWRLTGVISGRIQQDSKEIYKKSGNKKWQVADTIKLSEIDGYDPF